MIQEDFKKVIKSLHSCVTEEQVIVTDRFFGHFLTKYFHRTSKIPALIEGPDIESNVYIQIYNYEKDLMYDKIYKHHLVEA
jgi:hypothetical protein